MRTQVFTSSQFAAFALAIRQSESTDNYSKINKSGHLGAYQMAISALQTAGFVDGNGNWTPLAQGLGVNSKSSFLSHPIAQDIAFQNFTQKNFEYLHSYLSYVGKTIGGVHITEAGLLAGAHLVGQRRVERFLDTNGKEVRRDGNQVPVTEYMTKFSNYHFTFPLHSSGFSPAIDTAPQSAPTDPVQPPAMAPLAPSSKPASPHHAAALDMPDDYERLFTHLAGPMPDGGWHLPADFSHMQLFDGIARVTDAYFKTQLKAAPPSPFQEADADDAAVSSVIPRKTPRGGIEAAKAHPSAALRPASHRPTGYPNDPIFIYTDVKPGGH